MRARVCQRCGVIATGDCCRSETKQNTNNDGYGRRWQKFRARLVKKRAKLGTLRCGICKKAFGAESPHADHVAPVHSEQDPLFYTESNIQFLHPACHGKKTQQDVKQGLTR